MLIEDNTDDLVLTKRALKESGFESEISIAADGEQALNMLFGNNTTIYPDLILLDLKIPKISGIEVLKEIRSHEQTRRIPVVVLTTSNEDSDIAHSYDNGANSYLRKPVNFQDFIDQIGYVVTYWFTCNQVIEK